MRLMLCADDYAMNPQIDAAVLSLAYQRRITATSCMVTSPRWRQSAQALLEMRQFVDVGLHFNLTEGHGEPGVSLPLLILRAWTGRLDDSTMSRIWHAQLDAFEAALGTPPDFIDGHQHVHQFPAVRDALLRVLAMRYPRRTPWVRSTLPASPVLLRKETLLASLGGKALRDLMVTRGIAHNRGFAGAYGFNAPTPARYGLRMARWLDEARDGMLLMCHPAAGRVPGDPIGRQRCIEWEYLRSDAFGEALASRQIDLARWPLSP